MTFFHRKHDILDMEGVRGSNPRASTTLKPNHNKLLQRERLSLFQSFNRYSLISFSPWAFRIIGTISVHEIPSHIYRFGDLTTHETSLSESHFLTFIEKSKTRGIAWNAHETN